MMINKRLIGTVGESKKYIAGNVACQWGSLAANMTMMGAVAHLLQRLYEGTADRSSMALTAGVAAFAVIVRFVCSILSSRMSYLSSKAVKKTLREMIYRKLLRLGTSYREKVQTSEVVQVAVEGVDQLETYPLQFKTTDDTLVAGNEILVGNPNAVVFSADNIYPIDWKKYGTNIRREFTSGTSKIISIQDTVKKLLEADTEYKYLIFDHGTGEMADYIAIKEADSSIHISMFHVKAMKAAKFNSDVNDIYEVLQQAIKSSIWLKTKSVLLQKILSRRKSGKCVFIRGKLDELKQLLRCDKRLIATMYVVQPSISKSVELPDKYQEVLAAAKFYTLQSGRITEFKIWGSP